MRNLNVIQTLNDESDKYKLLIFSIDRWLVPPKPKRISQAFRDAFSSIPRQCSFTYVRNNAQLIFFHILFFIINLSLIVSRLVEYRNTINVDGSRNWSIMIARASGQPIFLY